MQTSCQIIFLVHVTAKHHSIIWVESFTGVSLGESEYAYFSFRVEWRIENKS